MLRFVKIIVDFSELLRTPSIISLDSHGNLLVGRREAGQPSIA